MARSETLFQSVGRGGANLPDDQRTVAQLLAAIPIDQGGSTAPIPISPIPGLPNSDLAEAIDRFQRINFNGVTTGLVEPGSRTLSRMNALASPKPPSGKQIRQSVGKQPAFNSPDDIDVVIDLLMRIPAAQGGPTEPIFKPPFPGVGSASLTAAIEQFQRRQFGRADGRVDPGGPTLARLNSISQNGRAPLRTIAPPDQTIGGAVGRQVAANSPADVDKVRTLLLGISPAQGGAAGTTIQPQVFPGQAPASLIAAIEKFQLRQLGFKDGRVDPGGRSIRRLVELQPR